MQQSVRMNQDSGEKTWLTPKSLIDALGTFDTDPATPKDMPWRTATRMLTIEDDGTKAPWVGRVWLNPPYGREAWPFLERMAHYQGGVSRYYSFARTRGNGTIGYSPSRTRFSSCAGEYASVGKTERRESPRRCRAPLSLTARRTQKRSSEADFAGRSSD